MKRQNLPSRAKSGIMYTYSLKEDTPMAVSEAQKRASRKYNDANIRQVKFSFSIQYDADILAKLDSVPNKQGYIKELIRADIARNQPSEAE